MNNDNPFQQAAANLEVRLHELIKQKTIACEQLTEQQFITAIVQAIKCGDFIRLCTPDGAQAVVYHPYRRKYELTRERDDWRSVATELYNLVDWSECYLPASATETSNKYRRLKESPPL